jgi:hypothetical protein
MVIFAASSMQWKQQALALAVGRIFFKILAAEGSLRKLEFGPPSAR